MVVASSLLCLSASASDLPPWIGFGPSASSGSVDLFVLDTNTVTKTALLGQIPIGAEQTWPDAFRCDPYGIWCSFLTFDAASGSSFVYNISAADATVFQRVEISQAMAFNLHINHAPNDVFFLTIAIGANSTQLVKVDDGRVTPLVDFTSFMQNGNYLRPGGSTQCSDDDSVWVGVHSGSGGPDFILELNYNLGRVTNVTKLQAPMIASLWSYCDDSDKVNSLGGIAVIDGVASYGMLLPDGSYAAQAVGTLPATDLQATGVLSQNTDVNFVFALYPPNGTSGFVGTGVFMSSANITFTAVDFVLTGCSVQ